MIGVLWVGSYVLAGFARQFNSLSFPKAGYHLGLTSLLLLAGAGSVHDATALNETRTLSFHHTHSEEDLTVTFKRDGRYDEEALKQLNHYLRDWRSQDQTTMDRRLFDILWEVYRDVDGKKPIQIISSYRSPATNAMLRRRSSGVARFSQHMRRASPAARRRRVLSDIGIAFRPSRYRQHSALAANDARSARPGVPGRPHRACSV